MSLNIKTDNGHKQLASLGGNIINGNELQHYSTEERIIGYWTDGKPIYRKVFSFDLVVSRTAQTVTEQSENLNLNDVADIISFRGRALRYGTMWYELNENEDTNDFMWSRISKNSDNTYSFTYKLLDVGNRDWTVIVILEYIKTTDIPIASNNSYSTDEVLTGKTWIDGKPIYRKVFTGKFGTHQTYNSNIRYNRAMLNLQFADIVTIGGYINTYRTDEGTSTTYKLLINSTALSWTTDGAVDKSCYCTVEPNGICLSFDTKYNGIWRSDNMDYVVIVEYTKTN